jgi:hypothetical protein
MSKARVNILVCSFVLAGVIVFCFWYYLDVGCFDFVETSPENAFIVSNSKKIVVVDRVVVDIKVRGQKIFVLQMAVQDYECDEGRDRTIRTSYLKDKLYWVLFKSTGKSVGPMSESAYHVFLKSAGFGNVELDVPTWYKGLVGEAVDVTGCVEI